MIPQIHIILKIQILNFKQNYLQLYNTERNCVLVDNATKVVKYEYFSCNKIVN